MRYSRFPLFIFLSIILFSPIIVQNVNVEALTVVSASANTVLNGANAASSFTEYALDRWWVFYCGTGGGGEAWKYSSSAIGGSETWSTPRNISNVFVGDCDTGAAQLDSFFNGTHFHIAFRENVAASPLRYILAEPLANGFLSNVREEVISLVGGGGAVIAQSGSNLYVLSRTDTGTDEISIFRSIDQGDSWSGAIAVLGTAINFNEISMTNFTSTGNVMLSYEKQAPAGDIFTRAFYGINASFGTEVTIDTIGLNTAHHKLISDSSGTVHLVYDHDIVGPNFESHYTNLTLGASDWAVATEWHNQVSGDHNNTISIAKNQDTNGTTVFNMQQANIRYAIQNESNSWENGVITDTSFPTGQTDRDFFKTSDFFNSTGFIGTLWLNNTMGLTNLQVVFYSFQITQPTDTTGGGPAPAEDPEDDPQPGQTKFACSVNLNPIIPGDGPKFDWLIGEHWQLVSYLFAENDTDTTNQVIDWYIDKNNVGNFEYFTSGTTSVFQRAVSSELIFDSTFIGPTNFQARFQGSVNLQTCVSPVITVNIASQATQFTLTIESEAQVQPGFVTFAQGLLTSQISGAPLPVQNELVKVWIARFDSNFDTRVVGESLTGQGVSPGKWGIGLLAPISPNTYNLKANVTIDGIAVQSDNFTMIVLGPDEIFNLPDDEIPGGGPGAANLDDFLPNIDEISFGFGSEGNGILLWMIFFLMFSFGGIFAMNRTFPESMSSQVVIGWFAMIFGASTAVGFGLNWIQLNFVILLLAPIALIGGIILLKIFRGGGTT